MSRGSVATLILLIALLKYVLAIKGLLRPPYALLDSKSHRNVHTLGTLRSIMGPLALVELPICEGWVCP